MASRTVKFAFNQLRLRVGTVRPCTDLLELLTMEGKLTCRPLYTPVAGCSRFVNSVPINVLPPSDLSLALSVFAEVRDYYAEAMNERVRPPTVHRSLVVSPCPLLRDLNGRRRPSTFRW